MRSVFLTFVESRLFDLKWVIVSTKSRRSEAPSRFAPVGQTVEMTPARLLTNRVFWVSRSPFREALVQRCLKDFDTMKQRLKGTAKRGVGSICHFTTS